MVVKMKIIGEPVEIGRCATTKSRCKRASAPPGGYEPGPVEKAPSTK